MQAFSMLLQYSLCLIVMTVTTSAFAAEPEVITVAPNFQVGDKIAFVTKKVRAQVINGATLPSPEVYWDNTIEVIEQDEHGFVLSWMRGKIRVDPPEPLPPAVTALADLWSDVRIDLLVTPEGRILDVSNYDDLKTYLEKTLVMTRDLLKEAGQDEALIDKTISTMRNLINDRSIGSTMLLKDIAGLFGAYQREIDIKGKTEYDIELPNPMGGSPIPATEVWQEPQPMAEDGTVIFRYEQVMDKEGLAKSVSETADKLGATDNLPKPEVSQAINALNLVTSGFYKYDQESGWFTHIKISRKMDINGRGRLESWEWILER